MTARPDVLDRPNILYITTDYTRGADLPATGAPFLVAPTLDKLCREGAVFTRHSCVAPICMPSRATMATGSYPHLHGLWDNGHYPAKVAGRPFLITDLKKNGYQTLSVGKMHWHPMAADYDYDVRIVLDGKDLHHLDDDYERYLRERGWSRKRIAELEGDIQPRLSRGQSYWDWPIDEALHADAFVGIKSIETVRNETLATDKPWFFWVSFTGPHNPWNAPKRFADLYRDMNALPEGDFVEGELDRKPLEYTRHRYGYGRTLFDVYDRADEVTRARIRRGVRAGHYGLLSFIDEWIGRLLDELKQRGQLDNTVVIFSSDHGSALFDNEMLHKGSAFHTQSLVPFVVWAPGIVPPGKRQHFSSHADLYATFLDLAGETHPPWTQGKSLVPMFLSPEAKVHDFQVIESTLVTSVMTDRWLAGFHHLTQERELYDLSADPMCHNNLADDPGSAETLGQLQSELVGWRKSVARPGERIGEDPLKWTDELGTREVRDDYRERYLKQYLRLVSLDDDRPGRTGTEAASLLEALGHLTMKFAGVTASHTGPDYPVHTLRLEHEPRSSSDRSVPRWTSRPQKGKAQWIEFDLGEPEEVKAVEVYWYQDHEGVQLPGSWHLEVQEDDGWKELNIDRAENYTTQPNTYNSVHPAESPVTDKLRIVIQPGSPDACVGVLSVNIGLTEADPSR